MGREEGGGFRMENTCTPMVEYSQCMAKPIQCCKKKKKWAELKQDLVSLSHNKIKLSWNAVFDKRLCEFLWL